MNFRLHFRFLLCSIILSSLTYSVSAQITYPIVDTDVSNHYNNTSVISAPSHGQAFYGQDATHNGNQPSYTDNGDGTITDNITGLVWQKSYKVMSLSEASEAVKSFKAGGHSDWRIPSIKEAYSLIIFSGKDVSSKEMNKSPYEAPFIDKNYFDFDYGSNGPRPIDVQVLTTTVYKGKTMGRDATVFGVNFADGRIKGYPIIDPRSRSEKKYTVRFVRGNIDYGKNNFEDNSDGTISDLATGLMWQKTDSKKAMNWEEALAWAQMKNTENYLGHNDWRLPNVKELQSIVDYTRSPQETNSAAIDPIFEISKIKVEEGANNYPFFWSSTTHENIRGADAACYVSFGEALGFFGPPHSSQKKLMDVHGAGAQRSDPKSGSASRFPQGRGPQGDVIRIYNYVRLVRDISPSH
jgi:hypothetical protein